jgi:RND family efflux transporter MFP subunit
MKTIYSLLAIAFVFASCAKEETKSIEEVIASNNIKEIRTKKGELDKQQIELNNKIKQLNAAIEQLDTVKKLPLVTALTAKKEVFRHYVELQGDVQTKQNVLIYPETAGTLEKVLVKEGQKVTKGQILAKIDDGGLKEQVAQLEATTALAKTTFERQKRLWDQKIGSEIQFLQAKTSYNSQKNTLKQLKIQLEKSAIKAPFSGIIDDVIKDEGTVVAPGPGAELFRIINLSNMYIEAAVPETYISDVTKGKGVEVYFPVLGERIDAKVRQSGNFINPANRTYQIEIAIPNSKNNIKPNLTAKLKINDYTNKESILIPQSIISENAAGEQYVYLIKDEKDNEGIAAQTVVKTGKTQGDVIEILEGISTGDKLIEAGARSVKDGQEVKIIQ